MEVLREKRMEREKQEQKNEEEVRRLHSLPIWSRLQRCALFLTFRSPALHPTKFGDHFRQGRLRGPIFALSEQAARNQSVRGKVVSYNQGL